MRKWLAAYSFTGAELRGVIQQLAREPDEIFYCPPPREVGAQAATVAIVKACARILESGPALLTLHGFWKIWPPDFLQACRERHVTIWNCHPGDTVKYQELRGKDPQARAIALQLPATRVVIHEVVAEVDAGPVIAVSDPVLISSHTTVESLTQALREKAIETWVSVLR